MNEQDREQRDRLIETLTTLSGGIESLRADMDWVKREIQCMHTAINGDPKGGFPGLAEKSRDNEARIRGIDKRLDKRDAAIWGGFMIIIPTAIRVAWDWIKTGK